MRCDSIFRIYSMTKPVVSLAVTMLMEAGRPDERHRIAEPFSVDPYSGEPVKLLDPCRPPALEMGVAD